MKPIKMRVLFLASLMTLLCSLSAHAAYNKTLYSGQGKLIKKTIDLNKDGKRDKIQIDGKKRENPREITINGKTFIVPAFSSACLGDIQTKDRYIEIITFSESRCRIYRYSGKKLKLYCQGRYVTGDDPTVSSLARKKNVIAGGDFKRANGDGTISFSGTLHADAAEWGEHSFNFYETFYFRYRVGKNSLRLDTTGTHICIGKPTIWTPATWIAYRYPRSYGNQMVFSTGKEEKLTPLGMKASTSYIYLMMKKPSTGQTGWVLFPSSNWVIM